MKNLYFVLLASVFFAAPSFALEVEADDTDVAFEQSTAMADSALEENRGTFAPVIINTSNLNADLNGNTVNGGTTGDNNISDGAFSGLNGFATVIQNSGNNVIIQDSTILNVFFNNAGGTP